MPEVKKTSQRRQLRDFEATSVELLERLSLAGCRLSTDGEDLLVKGHLTDDFRRSIRENKSGLMQLLQTGETDWEKQAEWRFVLLRIPSQTKRGLTDIWVVGERSDKPEITFWFVASQKQDE